MSRALLTVDNLLPGVSVYMSRAVLTVDNLLVGVSVHGKSSVDGRQSTVRS